MPSLRIGGPYVAGPPRIRAEQPVDEGGLADTGRSEQRARAPARQVVRHLINPLAGFRVEDMDGHSPANPPTSATGASRPRRRQVS